MTLKGKPRKKQDESGGKMKWILIASGAALIVVAAVAAWWIGECDREENMDTAAERIEGHFAQMPGHDVTAEIGGALRELLRYDYGVVKLRALAKKHDRIVYHEGLRTVWYGYRQGNIGGRQGCIGTVRNLGGGQPDVVHAGFGPALEIVALRVAGNVLTVTADVSTSETDKAAVAALGLEPGGRFEADVDVVKLAAGHVKPEVLGAWRKAAAEKPAE